MAIFGFVSALLLSGGIAPAEAAAPAAPSSDGIKIIAQGVTAHGGWVEFTGVGHITIVGTKVLTSSATVAPLTVKEVGGGTWDYGSSIRLNGKKACWSYYYHPSVLHGSTASMSDLSDAEVADAGGTSYAYVTKYTTATCYAYWRTY